MPETRIQLCNWIATFPASFSGPTVLVGLMTTVLLDTATGELSGELSYDYHKHVRLSPEDIKILVDHVRRTQTTNCERTRHAENQALRAENQALRERAEAAESELNSMNKMIQDHARKVGILPPLEG